jgi:hypothetical protein
MRPAVGRLALEVNSEKIPRNRIDGALCAALGVGTTAFAGGGEDCHAKTDATSARGSSRSAT